MLDQIRFKGNYYNVNTGVYYLIYKHCCFVLNKNPEKNNHTVLSRESFCAYWPTIYFLHRSGPTHMFFMKLPHILSISQFFLKFIEQRRLFFLVWYGFVKNFAREMTTLGVVHRP